MTARAMKDSVGEVTTSPTSDAGVTGTEVVANLEVIGDSQTTTRSESGSTDSVSEAD